jgi:hypothetical protein
MHSHQTLPELTVIRDEEVKKFVDDDVVPELRIETQEFRVEIQVAVG